jgi:imidazolonepropionase
LIRGARQLLTLRGPSGPRRGRALADLGLIPDGAILIRDGLIEEVGPARRVENLAAARGAREVSAAGRVVMPGFVDSHTHLLYPPRGERASDPEVAARIWSLASARLLALRTRRFLDAMARHGTTTVEAKTGVPGGESAALKALRVAALLRDGPIDLVPTHLLRLPDDATAEEADEIVSLSAPRLLRRGLAAFADIWWNGALPRREACSRFLAAAAACGAGLKVHASGPACGDAVALAVGHRAVSIDHLEHLTPELAPLLAGARTVATLMPASSLEEWAPLAPARALVDAGAAIALATNFNPHYAPVLSMQTVVAMACLRFGLSPEETITAATINGAHALGCADRVGSLETGKSADILLLGAEDYRDLPRAVGVNLVQMVFKSGAPIYREGAVARSAAG